MNLTQILAFAALSLIVGLACAWDRARVRAMRARGWVMLAASVVAVYWLQSSSPIRSLDFWLPTASIGLTVIVWAAIYAPRRAEWRAALPAGAVIIGIVAFIALTRYIDPLCCVTPTRPPDIVTVALGGVIVAALIAGATLLFRGRTRWLNWLVLGVIAAFVILKLDVATQALSAVLRGLNGQDMAQASALDVRWLGFSYIAFRLIHALRDRVTARPPAPGKPAPAGLTLREFVSYVVFFPALTAGPIDRADRFVKDYRNTTVLPMDTASVVAGVSRILLGVFKKFVIADTLAIVALNAVNAAQVNATIWMWVIVYAYALRIFFDFSGYTDIAIGLGRLFGIKLPENFDRPYLKSNLTLFWNSWHMSLSQWFRAYFFNPVTRALRSPRETHFLPAQGFFRQPAFIILFGQVTTMLLIGLWHGITWNFVVWGAWHAFGLFAHNRWAEFARRRNASTDAEPTPQSPVRRRVVTVLSVVATFNFVALGWVWFALPSIDLSLTVFRRLVGG